MAISGVTNSYLSYYAQSKSVEETNKKSTDKTNQESSSSNDAKQTSRTAEDYTKYLQKKFDYMNKSTSMEGIPTIVSVSAAFIKKCANDPEKAKFLEENLNAIPDCAKKAVAGCQGTLTNLSYQIDANGNIAVAISGTSDPDGKIAKENAERKAKENKEKEEKAEEKRAEEKKLEEKQRLEALADSGKNITEQQGNFSMTVSGSSVAEISVKLQSDAGLTGVGTNKGSFDVKA